MSETARRAAPRRQAGDAAALAAQDEAARMAETLIALLTNRGPLASVCPSEVARAIAGTARSTDWRALMPQVRDVASSLADEGLVRLTRHGRAVAAEERHHGILRIRRGPAFTPRRVPRR